MPSDHPPRNAHTAVPPRSHHLPRTPPVNTPHTPYVRTALPCVDGGLFGWLVLPHTAGRFALVAATFTYTLALRITTFGYN